MPDTKLRFNNSVGSGPPSPTVWLNVVFLAVVHIGSAVGLYFYHDAFQVTSYDLLVCAAGVALTTFGISAGYHRLFAHTTFETGSPFRLILLALASSALQNSAIEWVSNHRRHHRYTDTPADPYDATRGFWFSHIGWLFKEPPVPAEYLPDMQDLQADPLIRFQHRFFLPIGLLAAFALPWAIGFALGHGWRGLFFGGLLRLVISYHVTFSINSVAHWLGSQPYSTRGTARDSWLSSLFTMGEGYHNFHHAFPGDYRNGIRFYDFDPPKWVLAMLERLGIVHKLKRTPGHIIARRRLRADRLRLSTMTLSCGARERLERAIDTLGRKLRQWARRQTALSATSGPASRFEQTAIRGYRRSFWRSYQQWQSELSQAQ